MKERKYIMLDYVSSVSEKAVGASSSFACNQKEIKSRMTGPQNRRSQRLFDAYAIENIHGCYRAFIRIWTEIYYSNRVYLRYFL